jgi:hypothetical protein
MDSFLISAVVIPLISSAMMLGGLLSISSSAVTDNKKEYA